MVIQFNKGNYGNGYIEGGVYGDRSKGTYTISSGNIILHQTWFKGNPDDNTETIPFSVSGNKLNLDGLVLTKQ
jgi:hypothetical protein